MTADNCQTCGHTKDRHAKTWANSACADCACGTGFDPVAAPDDRPCTCGENHTDAEARAEIKRVQEAVAAREAAQAEATLTDAERERMVDAICEGRVRNCRGTVKNWGPAEDEAETHALLIRVLRGESEGFVRDVAPIVESILADRLAGRGHE